MPGMHRGDTPERRPPPLEGSAWRPEGEKPASVLPEDLGDQNAHDDETGNAEPDGHRSAHGNSSFPEWVTGASASKDDAGANEPVPKPAAVGRHDPSAEGNPKASSNRTVAKTGTTGCPAENTEGDTFADDRVSERSFENLSRACYHTGHRLVNKKYGKIS